jgi:hypothetical protein
MPPPNREACCGRSLTRGAQRILAEGVGSFLLTLVVVPVPCVMLSPSRTSWCCTSGIAQWSASAVATATAGNGMPAWLRITGLSMRM